jgi:Transcriptional regulators
MDNSYISSQELLNKSNILYEFVDLFLNYENTARDYGSDEFLSMNDVHILSAIDNNPGILSIELATSRHRSKSFISQVINKLETHGYIMKVSKADDNKKKLLFVTAKGKKLSQAHLLFDEKALIKTYNYLRRDCTPEEIDTFYKVMKVYNNIMNAAERKRRLKKDM